MTIRLRLYVLIIYPFVRYQYCQLQPHLEHPLYVLSVIFNVIPVPNIVLRNAVCQKTNFRANSLCNFCIQAHVPKNLV